MRIGTNELLIILVVVLLIFGPKNLPKLGKMFGKTMKNNDKLLRSDSHNNNLLFTLAAPLWRAGFQFLSYNRGRGCIHVLRPLPLRQGQPPQREQPRQGLRLQRGPPRAFPLQQALLPFPLPSQAPQP